MIKAQVTSSFLTAEVPWHRAGAKNPKYRVPPPPQTHFLPPFICGNLAVTQERVSCLLSKLQTRRQAVPHATAPAGTGFTKSVCVGCPHFSFFFFGKRHVGQQISAPDLRSVLVELCRRVQPLLLFSRNCLGFSRTPCCAASSCMSSHTH